VGVAILGSKAHGGLTSYALSIMILCLFNDPQGAKLRDPFQVFSQFLQVRPNTRTTDHCRSVHDWP
jgi:hypothetical protein